MIINKKGKEKFNGNIEKEVDMNYCPTVTYVEWKKRDGVQMTYWFETSLAFSELCVSKSGMKVKNLLNAGRSACDSIH